METWEKIQVLTTSAELADDPDFEALATASLGDLFDRPVQAEDDAGAVTIIFGLGAALSPHDELWCLGHPKRYAEAAVGAGAGANLGQRGTPVVATTRRLFYVDWPILDRHRARIAAVVSLWIDAQTAERPTALEAATLAATTAALVARPFRTRPMLNTTVWGGHWGQRQLGMGTDQPNTAVGYELIAPESGVMIGTHAELTVEVPFQLLVSLHPRELLGDAVHERFGASFPMADSKGQRIGAAIIGDRSVEVRRGGCADPGAEGHGVPFEGGGAVVGLHRPAGGLHGSDDRSDDPRGPVPDGVAERVGAA
jgi:hypothetical protein